MPVQSVINQYRGINAHLHSRWQAEGGWEGFHNPHITDIFKTLKAKLIPLGYTADVEASLQIRRLDGGVGKPKADVLISDTDPQRRFQSPGTGGVGVMTMTAAELLFEEEELSEKPYRAVAIRPFDLETLKRGDPVAWIELLSPTNKGDTEDAHAYRSKRTDILFNGIVFVEVDYLHELPSTFAGIPDYPVHKRKPLRLKPHAYRIIIIDPRPAFEKGMAQVVTIDVDQAIPPATIPLNAGDKVEFGFGVPYRKTFEEGLYGYDVDYNQLPANFDRYGPADQARIANRMLAILEAAQNGLDLETGPFPTQDLPLEEALAQLKVLSQP